MPARSAARSGRSAAAVRLLLAFCATIVIASGCVSRAPRVIRIGLVAPFEGRYREIGADVIPAVRLAIREWAAGYSRGGIVFELVAYDDQADPALAVEQARKLAADPDVAAVIGHWLDETTQAAAPVYSEAGLLLVTCSAVDVGRGPNVLNLSPSLTQLEEAAREWALQQGTPMHYVKPAGDAIRDAEQLAQASVGSNSVVIGGPGWGLGQVAALAGQQAEGALYVTGTALPSDSTEPFLTPERLAVFEADYTEGGLGGVPGPLAVAAYQATWLLMGTVARQQGIDIPETPASALMFDQSGRRADAPIYLYRWTSSERTLVATFP